MNDKHILQDEDCGKSEKYYIQIKININIKLQNL